MNDFNKIKLEINKKEISRRVEKIQDKIKKLSDNQDFETLIKMKNPFKDIDLIDDLQIQSSEALDLVLRPYFKNYLYITKHIQLTLLPYKGGSNYSPYDVNMLCLETIHNFLKNNQENLFLEEIRRNPQLHSFFKKSFDIDSQKFIFNKEITGFDTAKVINKAINGVYDERKDTLRNLLILDLDKGIFSLDLSGDDKYILQNYIEKHNLVSIFSNPDFFIPPPYNLNLPTHKTKIITDFLQELTPFKSKD